MVFAALLVLIQYPKGNADIGGNKEFTGKDNNGFYLIILNQLFADLQSIAVTERTVGKKEACYALGCFQVREHMKDPSIVGVALRGRSVVCPTSIVLQIIVKPTLQVERRLSLSRDCVNFATHSYVLRKLAEMRVFFIVLVTKTGGFGDSANLHTDLMLKRNNEKLKFSYL